MASAANVVEVTRDNFAEAVIAASERVPVLVDFWAEWCGPCQMQLPVLLKLAEEYQGRFILAKIDSDQEQELAAAHGIRSIPTMLLYRHGHPVDQILGAQSEGALRALLDQHVERPSDGTRANAHALREQGDLEGAIAALRMAQSDDPENVRITLDLVETQLLAGDLDGAEASLRELSLEQRADAEAKRLEGILLLARLAAGQDTEAPPGERPELDAQVAEAARLALEGELEASLTAWLALLMKRPNYREQVGRRGMLAVFDQLGPDDPLAKRYRSKMFMALH